MNSSISNSSISNSSISSSYRVHVLHLTGFVSQLLVLLLLYYSYHKTMGERDFLECMYVYSGEEE